ncbi:response regulator [Dechloromonas sp. XY25]|uniref:Response regulator n=1 Tax=Dechloromonas hankyongensis TaxID=2908002 RepID=A0ABS9K565_9RHOO|nr:response regulator [Dechloromonas hankyongensis]MCG2578225.1 response regulator [Dechloromonas hankyongensis]
MVAAAQGDKVGILDQIKALFGRPEGTEAATPSTVVVTGITTEAMVERRKRARVNAREGTRVLIIDDSKTIVAALRKFLRSAGYETLEALDAESGLQLLHEQKPDLIFLDIVLPGMNGFAALRAIRRDPVTRDTPVIMMSGNEQAMEQFFGTRIGADDFMKKPFSRYEIFFRIERLLDENLVPRRATAHAEARTADLSSAG